MPATTTGLLAATLAAITLAPSAAASTVVLSEVGSTNIRTAVEVSGSVGLLGIPVTVDAAGSLTLNELWQASPPPGGESINAVSASQSTSDLEMDANAGTDSDAVEASWSSNVDGLGGIRTALGDAFLTEANVSAGLVGVILPPVIELSLTSQPTDTIQATSTVTGDGLIGMTALAESNLLTSASSLSLSILGFDIPGIDITALINSGGQLFLAGTILDVAPTVLSDGITITGLISIIADETFENPANPSSDDFLAFAQAIGLQVNIDVNAQITELGLQGLPLVNADLDIVSAVVINETSTLMLTPEPGKAALLALGLFGLITHRCRR